MMSREEIQEVRAGLLRYLKEALDQAPRAELSDVCFAVSEMRLLLEDIECSDRRELCEEEEKNGRKPSVEVGDR